MTAVYGKIVGVRALLVTIAILVAPRAAADPKPRERAAVVAIDLGPSTPSYLRATATSQIEVGLRAAGYEVLPTSEVKARLRGELARCRGGACVRRVGEALGVRSAVFATIDGKDEDTIVAMSIHDARTGEREAEVREVCDLCGQTELAARLGVAASALRAYSLDARERKVKQAAKARAAPAAPAAPASPARAPRARARAREARSIVPGILVGAAGAIGVGAGLYLVALDGRGTCARGDQPVYPAPGAVIRYLDTGGFECRDVYRTRTPGIASAAAGVAAIAAGVALVVRARDRERAVEITPRPGGAAIGVSWSW